MRVFVGFKESDSAVALEIQARCGSNVQLVFWPNKRGEKIDEFSLFPENIGQPDDYYFHYSGYQKISEELLNLFDQRALNLHPAPPWYRGSGGLNLAIYYGEKKFGLTLHHLSPTYDDGQIIKLYDVELHADENIMSASLRINNLRLQIFKQIIQDVCDSGAVDNTIVVPTDIIKWEGRLYKMSEIDDLALVNLDNENSFDDLNRRIKAFATKDFPLVLKSRHGNYKVYSF